MVTAGVEVGDVVCPTAATRTGSPSLLRSQAGRLIGVVPRDGPEPARPAARTAPLLGAVISNGNLYCPKTPASSCSTARPAQKGERRQKRRRSHRTSPAHRRARQYKLGGRERRDDEDGYHRFAMPGGDRKVCRCPLRPDSMSLPRSTAPRSSPRPSTRPSAVCKRASPSRGHRRPEDPPAPRLSFAPAPPLLRAPQRSRAGRTRRSRTPLRTTSSRGWSRLMGLSPPTRSFSPVSSPSATSASSPPGTPARPRTHRRAAAGLPPRTTQTPPENHPRQPHRPAITRPRRTAPHAAAHQHAATAPCTAQTQTEAPRQHAQPAAMQQANTKINSGHPARQPEMSDLNVNMVPTET